LIFREVLQKALENTEGCLGILIMGTDGIPVQKVLPPEGTEFDFDIAVAEYTSLIKNAKRSETGPGKLQEVALTSENGIFILRFVNDDYFIAMITAPDGNFGRGRYELRRAALLLEKELDV
jgi:predicted regulator of Ras-like GTPase activity (Roadblock/LC7/MglB family)